MRQNIGRLTDAQGRVVSFENTVIVMTSNAGSQSSSTPAGFGRTVSQMSKDRVMKALEEIMRPEFLNRIDEIIAFNQLTEDNFRLIAEIMLNELKGTLADKEIRLTWDDSLLALLVEKSYSVKYGARNLRRLIEKEIENPLANAIVTGDKPLLGAQPDIQAKLTAARDRLLDAAAQMQKINELNSQLLAQAIELAEFDITLFKSMRQAPETANYDRNAYNTGDILGSSGFDAKQ